MQAFFLNFCFHSLSHIPIDFIEVLSGFAAFLKTRPFTIFCRKML